jgi:DNA polymerase-3 subunit gamma/tau
VASSSLYRKYRPEKFGDMIGQDHVTTALRNAAKEDRVGHAYLFSGPRGTGKTTTARILARALNCLELGADGEPCGKCENCSAIASGTFYDLVELDAASNNGVDAMRDLISNVHIGVGASSKRKVYILDEVHMLSAAASNTMLKTLEEAPEHVVFVLATTDPHKVLPTIRSRTQHFEFTLLSAPELTGYLADVILRREGIESDPAALDAIVRRAGGSVRDALSLLDQALAVGGGALDAERVQQAFGGAGFDERVAVLEAVAQEDVAGVLVAVHEMVANGHDPRRVAEELLRTLRDAFLQANASGRVPYDGPAEEGTRLAALAKDMGNVAVVRAIEILGQAIIDIRGQAVADPRLVLEVALVRITRREARTRDETLLDRVERLEARMTAGGTSASAPAPAAPATERPAPKAGGPLLAARPRRATKTVAEPEAEPPQLPAAPPDGDFTLDDVIEAWPDVLAAMKPPVRATLQDAQPVALEDGVIVFGAPKARKDAINDRFRKEAETIKQVFAGRLGTAPRFSVRSHDFAAHDALAPAPTPAAEPAAPPEPEEEAVDLRDLVDAPDAPASEPVARLAAELGAEIVEERPR